MGDSVFAQAKRYFLSTDVQHDHFDFTKFLMVWAVNGVVMFAILGIAVGLFLAFLTWAGTDWKIYFTFSELVKWLGALSAFLALRRAGYEASK